MKRTTVVEWLLIAALVVVFATAFYHEVQLRVNAQHAAQQASERATAARAALKAKWPVVVRLGWGPHDIVWCRKDWVRGGDCIMPYRRVEIRSGLTNPHNRNCTVIIGTCEVNCDHVPNLSAPCR